ncbi:MAG: replicative DNA helicase [Phycisphaerales bacterium]|nr:replicative DNA helicase [Phycisphaerales bacterium]
MLGSMLLDEAAIGEALTILRDIGEAAFFFEKNATLFQHILELYDQRKPLDGVVIKDELVRRGIFERLGGYEFLGELVSAVPSALRVRQYAEIVRDKYLLRDLIGAAHRVMESAYDDRLPAAEMLDLAEQQIFAATEKRVTAHAKPLPELVDQLMEMLRTRGEAALTGVPTGYYELDEYTCGLQPQELIIVAGRPSMGKTAFGLNIAENMSVLDSRPVVFFSLEMSQQQVAQRIVCSRARIDAHKMRRGMLGHDDMRRLNQAGEAIGSAPLLVDDTANLSILELRARARMYYRKYHTQAIFVDYLQLLHSPGVESRQQEVAAISRGLKALAKELNVPVVAMAQLNRNPEDRKDNKPKMSDLRESGAIEQDADVIMLLHREAYYNRGEEGAPEDNTAELIIAKQRNGPVGTVMLTFNKQFTRFDNHKPGGTDYVPATSDYGTSKTGSPF